MNRRFRSILLQSTGASLLIIMLGVCIVTVSAFDLCRSVNVVIGLKLRSEVVSVSYPSMFFEFFFIFTRGHQHKVIAMAELEHRPKVPMEAYPRD